MNDAQGRTINYMRVSITDRCNLRCKYCMPQDIPVVPHQDILRYEEILRLCGIMAGIGIRAVKVTGGEPLVRMGCVDFIRDLKRLPGIEHVTLTTNGVLLEAWVEELAQMGLGGVNISLDSLNSDVYRHLTGQDAFHLAWSALQKSLNAGLRVKINCVPIKGLNDSEIIPLARLSERFPLDVRFIELMPTASGKCFGLVTGDEIIDLLSKIYPDLEPDDARHGFGPARYFRSARLRGGIGLIDAVTNHFCGACNRIRLTGEGFLKLCLYHDDGLDLRGMLRNGTPDAEIKAAIKAAVRTKPRRHEFGDEGTTSEIRAMSKIGG